MTWLPNPLIPPYQGGKLIKGNLIFSLAKGELEKKTRFTVRRPPSQRSWGQPPIKQPLIK
ncbi:MAG: hypothetical protein Kow00121_51450 [Elainellaceae cyanobacterium]